MCYVVSSAVAYFLCQYPPYFPLNFFLGGLLGQPCDERLAAYGLLHKRRCARYV